MEESWLESYEQLHDNEKPHARVEDKEGETPVRTHEIIESG